MLMTERHRLGSNYFCIGDIRRALELNARPEDDRNKEDRAEDGGTGDGVRTAMKNLHRLGFHCSAIASCLGYLGLDQVRHSQTVVISVTKTCDYSRLRFAARRAREFFIVMRDATVTWGVQ